MRRWRAWIRNSKAAWSTDATRGDTCGTAISRNECGRRAILPNSFGRSRPRPHIDREGNMIRHIGGAASLLWFSFAAFTQTAPPTRPLTDPVDDAARAGFAVSLVGKGQKLTEHSVTIRGQRVDYTAMVSGSVIQDADRQPSAIFVTMSYIRKSVADP